MHERFEEVFYEEFHGICSRFRDEDFALLDDEIAFINAWIDYMKDRVRRDCVGKQDVKDLIELLFTLHRSPLADSFDLLLRIQYEIGYMNDSAAPA